MGSILSTHWHKVEMWQNTEFGTTSFTNKTLSNFTRGQFHQLFTSSFYVRTSQKHKKTRMTWLSFFLLESVRINAASKLVGEINPSTYN